MSKTVQISSQAHFRGLLKTSRIVVVDFYADWCGPCKMIAPVYEKLSEALSRPNHVTFVKVDSDKHQNISRDYSVRSLPTFIVFRDSAQIDRVEGANHVALQAVVKKLVAEVESIGSAGEAGSSSSSSSGGHWRGAELPRSYTDVSDQVEQQRCELLNYDSKAGNLRVLFDGTKPSVLSGGKPTSKDWVESDTDEQLLLFVPFSSMIKLHTIQITSCPPAAKDEDGDEDDELPTRPCTIKLFTNKTHNLGFDEAESMTATQTIELNENCWNKEGTASIPLKYVKFQNITSLVLFVQEGEGDSEKTRIDRIRLVGETGEKREMGKLEKVGDEPGE